jgi:hypothetical protein
MPDTTTANYSFTKPEIGASEDTWGDKLNQNWDNLDGYLADKFGPDNILGTVSQSAGVPTGALIERGSNANGEYVLYADGTLMCWHFGLAEFTGSASVLQEVWTYPYAFTARPSISLTPMHHSDGAAPAGANWNGGQVINCHSRTTGVSSLTAYVSGAGSWASGDAVAMHMIARGRAF